MKIPKYRFIYQDLHKLIESKNSISTILFAFQSRFENNWGLVSASAVMMVAPVAILFMFFQKKFIAGLTSGATKG